MSNYRFGSWPSHNGKKVMLYSEPGETVYRHGTSTTDLRLKMYTDAQVTNATGAVTFTLPANYFSAVNAANAVAVRNTADPAMAVFALVRSVTQSSVIVQCFEGNVITTLLLGQGNGLRLPSTAVPVFLTAWGVGP